MIAVSEFFPRLIPFVNGCTEPMAAQALVDSAIDFCQESLAVRLRLAPQQTAAGTPTFNITPPLDQLVARVLRVWVSGAEIGGGATDQVDDAQAARGRPCQYYTRQNAATLQGFLYPVPDATYPLQVEVALRPTRSATTLEDELLDVWMEPVIEGAKARLMALPDQPFSNVGMAGAAIKNAIYLTRKARIEVSYGRVRTTQRVRPNPLA